MTDTHNLSGSERTVRLETLMTVLAEKMEHIENKIDSLNSTDGDFNNKLEELKAELIMLNSQFTDLKHDYTAKIEERIDELEKQSKVFDGFRKKVLLVGALVSGGLGLIATAFGSNLSAFFSAFFGG